MASVILRKDSEPGPDTGVCAIVALYEDNSSRDAAIRLCNSLEKVFDSELEFEITWCRFKYFSDPDVASEAAELAARADVILVSVPCAQDLPLEVKAWFERWLSKWKTSEGAVVLLQSSEPAPGAVISENPYLYLLAQRANVDFISLSTAGAWTATDRIPQNVILPHPRSVNSTRDSQHHSRSGINE